MKISQALGTWFSGNPVLKLASRVFCAVFLAYYSTVRIRFENAARLPQNLPPDRPVIYVFWHDQSFLALGSGRGCGVVSFSLLDWKNRLFDGLCARLGYRTVPMRSVPVATRTLIQHLKAGRSAAIALDGPHGPPRRMKPGAFYVSRRTGTPIVAVRVRMRRSVRAAWRWDRYELPLPFSQAVFSLSEPIAWENTDDAMRRVRCFLDGGIPSVPAEPCAA